MPYFNLALACCGGLSPTTKSWELNFIVIDLLFLKVSPLGAREIFLKQKTI
jgi:hypothetical protein